jgi:CheY-like chemotaxis protein
MVLSALAGTLEPGIQVKSFADPIEALSYAEEHTPDLLITDFQMPTIDGAELIRRFRGLSGCRQVPAVVVTAHEDVRLRALALEAGANDFVLSPLDHDAFRDQSRRLLEMSRSGQLPGPPIDYRRDGPHGADPLSVQIQMLNRLVEGLAEKLLHKTGEISHLSAEMKILLEATETAAIFVDDKLLVRQFTKPASDIFNLRGDRLGRSLSELHCRLDYDQLDLDFAQVQATGEILERYLQSRTSRRHYRLRLIPIKDGFSRLLGVVLIFTAIPAWHECFAATTVH